MDIEKLSKILSWVIFTELITTLWLALAYSYPYLSGRLETLPLALLAYFPYNGITMFGTPFCTAIVSILSGIFAHDVIMRNAFGGDNDH